MRLARLLVLLLAVLVLAACAHGPPRPDAAPAVYSELDAIAYGPPPGMTTVRKVAAVVPVNAMAPNAPEPYLLDTGDKLRIVVFGQEALSNNYTVDAAGMITMPLIGAVKARALTTSQLTGAIIAKLKASFIRDPSVAIEVEVYRPFFVLGEVLYPGQYPFVPNTAVENAVAIAGGFTPRAFRYDVRVRRRTADGEVVLKLPLNAPLCPGDTITVTERWF